MSNNIVILGATSKIAQEVAKLAAADGKTLLLVARNPARLASVAGDLSARTHAKIDMLAADLANISTHSQFVSGLLARMPDVDTVFLAYGTLGDQGRAEDDPDYALSELTTNFTSAVSLLTRLSLVLEQRRRGCIAVITSVAGDRARRSNYIYGTAKGALALFLQGLRAKLFRAGVRVLTIKPGPVATPMTASFPNAEKFAKPEKVARVIYREIESGHRDILYVPGIWLWIMLVIRHLPESVSKRLKF